MLFSLSSARTGSSSVSTSTPRPVSTVKYVQVPAHVFDRVINDLQSHVLARMPFTNLNDVRAKFTSKPTVTLRGSRIPDGTGGNVQGMRGAPDELPVPLWRSPRGVTKITYLTETLKFCLCAKSVRNQYTDGGNCATTHWKEARAQRYHCTWKSLYQTPFLPSRCAEHHYRCGQCTLLASTQRANGLPIVNKYVDTIIANESQCR